MKEQDLTLFKQPDIGTIFERAKKIMSSEWENDLKMLDKEGKTYKNYILPQTNESKLFNEEITNLFHLSSVSQSDEIEELIQQLIPLFTEYSLKEELDIRFYDALLEIQKSDLTINQQQYIDKVIKSKKINGIDLPDDTKKELSKIDEELSLLSTDFSLNAVKSLEKIKVELNKEDLTGLTEDMIESLYSKEEDKYYISNLTNYHDYLQFGSSREKRKELYEIFSKRAPENRELIEKILVLRRKNAEILGYENFSSLVLEERDANNTNEIYNMLDELKNNSKDGAIEEMRVLEEFAKDKDNIDKLTWYDVSYYKELYTKENFDLDNNLIKTYFEADNTINGILAFIEDIFGIAFVKVHKDKDNEDIFWHEDVQLYKLFDKNNEYKLIGAIYFDLFEREKKNAGAWKSGISTYRKDENDIIVLPTCNVVANFQPKNKDGVSLLYHDDIVTIFHEMGHALHHLLSKVEVSGLSGTNVLWDVVEFPSQFLEYYAYDKDIIKSISKHYQTGEVIPEAWIDNIINSKNYMKATHTLTQVRYSMVDVLLHSTKIGTVEEIINKVVSDVCVLEPLDYARHVNTFTHIFAGGYASGYYSYKWAEILSAGAFNFVQNSDNQKEALLKYKEMILEKGGTVNMIEQFEKMTGNKPDIKDLLRIDGIIK